MIASGLLVHWPLFGVWARPQPDNRADPKIKVVLSVSNLYENSPQDIQADSTVTGKVNNARNFWSDKTKGRLLLDWNGTITAVKSCDPVAFPNGCGGNAQKDVSEITSAVAATEFVRRFCDPTKLPKCTAKGAQLGFNRDEGTALGYTAFTGPTSAPIFLNISAIAVGALEDSSTDDSSNHDVSHELGHEFQLRHVGWSLPSNLMCTGVLPSFLNQINICPTHAGGRLAADQIVDVLKGASQFQQ